VNLVQTNKQTGKHHNLPGIELTLIRTSLLAVVPAALHVQLTCVTIVQVWTLQRLQRKRR